MNQKSQNLKLLLSVILIFSFTGCKSNKSTLSSNESLPSIGYVIVTDMMIDDFEAIAALTGSSLYANSGRDALFIVTDGDERKKANALFGLKNYLNIQKSKIFLGGTKPLKAFTYMKGFLDDRIKHFLDPFLAIKEITYPNFETINAEYLNSFAKGYDKIDLLLFAGPEAINRCFIRECDWAKKIRIASMGLYKAYANDPVTSFNGNTNIDAFKTFLSHIKSMKARLISLPTDRVPPSNQIMPSFRAERKKVLVDGNEIAKEFSRGIRNFQASLFSVQSKQYGGITNWLSYWDEINDTWLQDPVTVAINQLGANAYKDEGIELHLKEQKVDFNSLGHPVIISADPESHIRQIVSTDNQLIGKFFKSAYGNIKINENLTLDKTKLSPELVIDDSIVLAPVEEKIVAIVKGAPDDWNFVRAASSHAKENFALLIPESSPTPVLAALYRKYFKVRGSSTRVVTGPGQTLAEMTKIPSLGLEHKIFSGSKDIPRYGCDILPSCESLYSAPIPTADKAAKEILKLLDSKQRVSIYNLSSLETLAETFSRIDARQAKFISQIHIMGGSRNGTLTRNGAINPVAVRDVLQFAEKFHIKVYLYDSSVLSGNLTPYEVPATYRLLKSFINQNNLEAEEGIIESTRSIWMNSLAALKNANVLRDGIGSPLGTVMTLPFLLGKSPGGLFGVTKIELKIKPDGSIQEKEINQESQKWGVLSLTPLRSVDYTLLDSAYSKLLSKE